jgi:hypothetical protein
MPEDWVSLVLLVVVAVVIGGALSAWVQRRVGGPRRLDVNPHAQRWNLDAGLRVLTGEQQGLSRRWRHGRAVLEPGSITLRPCRWGLRIFPMAPVVVSVVAIDTNTARRSGWRSAWSVSPGARLVEVTTTTGATLQLAATPMASDEVLQVLAPRPA